MTDKNFSITLGEYKGIKRAPITADVTNDEVTGCHQAGTGAARQDA